MTPPPPHHHHHFEKCTYQKYCLIIGPVLWWYSAVYFFLLMRLCCQRFIVRSQCVNKQCVVDQQGLLKLIVKHLDLGRRNPYKTVCPILQTNVHTQSVRITLYLCSRSNMNYSSRLFEHKSFLSKGMRNTKGHEVRKMKHELLALAFIYQPL